MLKSLERIVGFGRNIGKRISIGLLATALSAGVYSACQPGGGSDGGSGRCKGKIAYVQNLTGNPEDSEIYVMDCNGKNQLRLTLNNLQDYSPAFSPDGTRIAWARNDPNDPNSVYRGIWTAYSDGTIQFQLSFEDDANPSWSIDGSEIAFDRFRSSYDIWVKPSMGGLETQLTNTPQRERNPSHSPDGTRLAFERNGDIWDMLTTGVGERQLTNASAIEEAPDYSPDGLQIAYHKWDTIGNTNIWVMDNDGLGSNQTALTFYSGFPPTFNSSPSWGPDGLLIYFWSNRDGVARIYLMKENNGDSVKVSKSIGGEFDPDWGL